MPENVFHGVVPLSLPCAFMGSEITLPVVPLGAVNLFLLMSYVLFLCSFWVTKEQRCFTHASLHGALPELLQFCDSRGLVSSSHRVFSLNWYGPSC